MEKWRKVWRKGFKPLLNESALKALKKALEENDPKLIQGMIVVPFYSLNKIKCVCPIAYCGWIGDNLSTVEEVNEFFSRMCFECGERMGEPSACRYFLNFWDENPKEEVRKLLLEELN